MSRALDLAPNSANTWRMYGDRYWRAYTDKGKVDAIREAVLAYRRAVDLYPSNGPHRAKLALALRAAGDEAGFRHEAARALRLDDLTPHADKKLDDADRDELRAGLKRSIRQEN
jgi:tetratricopeptide (TPR) repeat protein